MKLRIKSAIIASTLCMVMFAVTASAQSPITTITLGPEQIGVVKTAPGITTRITFQEKIFESVCGDLYDAATGKGAFVIQPSGNDLFLKPINSKGMSNLFVKIGEDGKTTYNFDLMIVPAAQAHRVVNVVLPASFAQPAGPGTRAPSVASPQPGDSSDKAVSNRDLELRKADLNKQADEILRNARQQADSMIAEYEARLADIDKLTSQRAQQESERRFVQALMLGLRETKINNPRVASKKVIVTLDSRVLMFNDKSYLRYTIQNTGESDFSFSSIALEASSGGSPQTVSIELVQSKAENKLAPGESMAGVIVFDSKSFGAKDRLTLFVRGEDNAEIAHLGVQ